jgi:hypothetical protein
MKIIKSILTFAMLWGSSSICNAQDPNFHIYLCIGQSNMEGQGTVESVDQQGFDATRFRVFGTVNCSGNGKTYSVGTQTAATAQLFRCNTKVSLVENFGKVYLAGVPSSVKVGVVPVAIAGCKIELFDKNNYASYANGVESWMKNIINEYGGNPYSRLITVAKEAQKVGVIKGILFHQGESNSGEDAWRTKVKGVYDNILADLSLTAANCPILIGEMLSPGQCSGHNSVIAKMPSTIATSYVISSANCAGQSDNLHFNSSGYRLLGQRYAEKMLTLIGPTCATPAPTVSSTKINYEVGDVATQLSATGTSLKWYVGTSTTAQTTAPTPSTATAGVTTYSVSQTANGCESGRTTITVTVASTFKIYRTNTPIEIDGVIDESWNNSVLKEATVSKVLSGTVSNTSDLSAKCKALWDNTYLYVLGDVNDQTLNNDSQNWYDDDAIEVYIDVNNDKPTSFADNDFQYTFGWNDGTTVGANPSGRSSTGVTYKMVAKTGGYIFEARIPWSTVQANPALNQLIGFDFMVNDDDNGGTRDKKISWTSATDNAYQDPSLFGVAKLSEAIVTNLLDDAESKSSTHIYPNPFNDELIIETDGDFEYQLFNQIGEVIEQGTANDKIKLNKEYQKGLYVLKVTQNQVSTLKTLIKN